MQNAMTEKVNFFQLEGIYCRSYTVTNQKGGRGGGYFILPKNEAQRAEKFFSF